MHVGHGCVVDAEVPDTETDEEMHDRMRDDGRLLQFESLSLTFLYLMPPRFRSGQVIVEIHAVVGQRHEDHFDGEVHVPWILTDHRGGFDFSVRETGVI